MTTSLPDLPRLDASLVTQPLAEAYSALVDCLERRILECHSSRNLYYETIYGLLLLCGQSFGAVGTLVHDAAGDRSFPVQAAMLARSMIEGLGNVLALRESPEERARLFALATARDLQRNLKALVPKFTGPGWTEWAKQQEEQLLWWRALVRITPEEWNALPRWPTPSQISAFLTESAADVWDLLYLVWYNFLSGPIHQTGPAAILAIQRHRSRGVERQILRQDSVVAATLAHACTVTEIYADPFLASPPARLLRTVWKDLRPWSTFADEVYDKRYRALLAGL
jgi:hypothetical protein